MNKAVTDMNTDDKGGLSEVACILQRVAGMRSNQLHYYLAIWQ